MTPAPTVFPVILLWAVGFIWIISDQVGVLVVQQLALVTIIIGIVWAILGHQIAKYLIFPLFFLFFSVPLGEELIPSMMEFTADFTVQMIRLSGIPVYREGLFFSLPSGDWSVVKACSGIRYLIASVTLGFLFAYITYTSNLRRIVFIIASIIVPIIANGVRAYIIVMLGHLSGMTLAVGVDHLIYGWLFFGIVMLLLFWLGSLWREDRPEGSKKQDVEAIAVASPPAPSLARNMTVFSALIISTLVWPVFAGYLENKSLPSADDPLLVSPEVLGNWHLADTSDLPWQPGYQGYEQAVTAHYSNHEEDIFIYLLVYRNQRQGQELINSANQLIAKDDKAWRRVAHGIVEARALGSTFPVKQALLRSPGGDLLTWHWNRVGGVDTINAYQAKLIEAKEKILGRSGDGIAIFVAVPQAPNTDRQSLLQDIGSELVAWLENTKEQ